MMSKRQLKKELREWKRMIQEYFFKVPRYRGKVDIWLMAFKTIEKLCGAAVIIALVVRR